MEELNLIEKVFIGGLVLCWAINLALPAVLWAVGCLISFWNRLPLNTYNWANYYQNMKYKWIFGNLEGKDSVAIYLTADLCLITSCLGLLIKITEFGYLLPLIVTSAVIAGLFFIPRFIMDVCKTLKYKPKTGESETIEKLKEDVRTLKERLDNKQ